VKFVDCTLRLPDDLLHPMAAFVRHEDVVRYEELLTWRVRPDEDIEYELFYVEADPPAYREAVAEVETIVDYRVAPIDDSSLHLWVCEETLPQVTAWRNAFLDRQLVVVPPVRFDDEAVMGMTIVGDGPDIQAVLDAMPAAVDVTVTEIGTYDRRGGTLAAALTDPQLEALATALSMGYYDVPRGATLADVASALGVAESSASEVIRRAERAVFTRVLERYGGQPLGDHRHAVAES
jgi:predicted DNA binding protein